MESANTVDQKLFDLSVDGDLEGVVDALAQGGRVAVRSPQGFTPLLAAARNGHIDICGLLLAHGSDANEVILNTKWTALHLAAGQGHEAVVEALLSWEAIVDPQNYEGATPLHFACEEGHLACALTILKAGANVSLTNNDGSLPIHMAAARNKVKIVRALLDYGCSPDMVSCRDQTIATIISPFILSVEQSNRDDTTHECSVGSSR